LQIVSKFHSIIFAWHLSRFFVSHNLFGFLFETDRIFTSIEQTNIDTKRCKGTVRFDNNSWGFVTEILACANYIGTTETSSSSFGCINTLEGTFIRKSIVSFTTSSEKSVQSLTNVGNNCWYNRKQLITLIERRPSNPLPGKCRMSAGSSQV